MKKTPERVFRRVYVRLIGLRTFCCKKLQAHSYNVARALHTLQVTAWPLCGMCSAPGTGSVRHYTFTLFIYSSMAAATCLEPCTASTTVLAPRTTSPEAKMPGRVVAP